MASIACPSELQSPRGLASPCAGLKCLIAEDDPTSRQILEYALSGWGFSLVVATDGAEAWEALRQANGPLLAILDWMMPHMDGLTVCRNVRAEKRSPQPYLLLVTQKEGTDNIIQGLEAGADDYVVKPFDAEELRARVQVGERMVRLQIELADRIRELEHSLAHIKQLQGLLPICAHCKKIRDDGDYWHSVESYLHEHADAKFTHTICPDCFAKICQDMKLSARFEH